MLRIGGTDSGKGRVYLYAECAVLWSLADVELGTRLQDRQIFNESPGGITLMRAVQPSWFFLMQALSRWRAFSAVRRFQATGKLTYFRSKQERHRTGYLRRNKRAKSHLRNLEVRNFVDPHSLHVMSRQTPRQTNGSCEGCREEANPSPS